KEHLGFYLQWMTAENSGYYFQNIEVLVTELNDEKMAEKIESNIFGSMKKEYPTANFTFYPERETGRGYYQKISFQINAANKSKTHFNLIDGGFTDWTQQYLSNKKERLLISGMGSELISLFFSK